MLQRMQILKFKFKIKSLKEQFDVLRLSNNNGFIYCLTFEYLYIFRNGQKNCDLCGGD